MEELIWWRGEGATLDRWLAALPPGTLGARPRLALARALQALVAGADGRGRGRASPWPSAPRRRRWSSRSSRRSAGSGASWPTWRRRSPSSAPSWPSAAGDAERTAALRLAGPRPPTEDDQQLRLRGAGVAGGGRLDCAVGWPEAEHRRSSRAVVDLQIDGRPEMATAPAVRPGPDPAGRRAVARGRADVPPRPGAAGAAGTAPVSGAGLQQIGLAEVLRQRGDLDAALATPSTGVRALARPDTSPRSRPPPAWPRWPGFSTGAATARRAGRGGRGRREPWPARGGRPSVQSRPGGAGPPAARPGRDRRGASAGSPSAV